MPGRIDSTPIFGVSLRTELNDPKLPALISQAGVHWVRTSISWASVEPSPGQFVWAGVDAHLSLLDSMGLTPIVYISQNPAWAAASPCGPIDRVPLSEFAGFVAAVAGRYSGRTAANGQQLPKIDYWQFYNEPDNSWTSGDASGFDGCWGKNGAQYAQMLAAAWQAVHAANPEGRVVFGGIAGEQVACPSSWSCAGQPIFNFSTAGGDFVDDVLSYIQAHPQSAYFDVFDFHYYPGFHTVWDDYGDGIGGKAEYYRRRLATTGIQRLMVCTEAGRRSDPGQVIDKMPGSNQEQSRYVVRLFVQGMAAHLGSIMWFTMADMVEPKQGGAVAWGLVRDNLEIKPSYTAYAVLTKELAGSISKGKIKTPPGVSGYVFIRDGQETTVLWAAGGDVPVTLTGRQFTRVDLWGQESVATDGAEGDSDQRLNGSVRVMATADPIYLRASP